MSEATRQKTGMALWLRILLFASLAVNLLVVGLAVGVMRHGPPSAKLAHGDPFGGPYLRAMEKDDRREIYTSLRKDGEGRRSRDDVRAEFNEVIAALRAVPYQAERAEAIILGQFNDIQSRAQSGTDAMLARMRNMSDEARQAYADRLEEALKRGPHKGKDGKKGRDQKDRDYKDRDYKGGDHKDRDGRD